MDVEDLLEAGDHVIAVGRASGKLRSGADAGYGFVHIFTLDAAKVTRFREWGDPDPAPTGGRRSVAARAIAPA